LKFHAGAGTKQNQRLLPFPRTTKMNVLGHHYFAQKHPETSQIKFKGKMAPTIALKISPTLRTGVGSTVGAKDGSPAADSGPVEAKRQKMAGGEKSLEYPRILMGRGVTRNLSDSQRRTLPWMRRGQK
jgi:hypothetical protein